MESEWISLMNRLGGAGKAFLAIMDFEMRHPLVIPLSTLDPQKLMFNFRGRTNIPEDPREYSSNRMPDHIPNPSFISSMDYEAAFRHVQNEQIAGNSVLTNLTFPSEIHPEGEYLLKERYPMAAAPYRLWADIRALRSASPGRDELLPDSVAPLPDEILVFSPETFIQTHHGRIYTYPMKGTAAVEPGGDRKLAEAALIADEKELAEHTTVVDLLRNDLGRFARDVRVEQFRYVEAIPSAAGTLLQASSRISAVLPPDWKTRLGELFAELLPAGSVSGAPKRETCRIIAEAESLVSHRVPGAGILPEGRGYYTGVAAVFDGWNLDSAVLIRFIEQRTVGRASDQGRRWFFRSGGGITIYSDRDSEYRELMDKVRFPIASGTDDAAPRSAQSAGDQA
jgi:para-aminobenzoate synthetase component 1